MAAYTSTQSGNFSSSATWGGAGAPSVDGDTFTVTAGHTVTIDTSVSNPTNGFGDSNVYGILQSQLGQSVTLRMDGRLYIQSGGTLHLRAGATVEITGTSAEQHAIWGENAADVNIIMEGSDGMPSTTLAAGTYNEGVTVLPVASAANFAAGEWISLFDNQTATTSENAAESYRDEGFWIHDIDGNNIYFRLFTGPNDVTITGNYPNFSTIVVSNAKKFRVGQQIIFGFGTERNIKTITAIDYVSNHITLNSGTSGFIVGEYVYLTGTEKKHTAGDKIRKIATVATASAGPTSTTITVANANLFSAGDDIWIERRSEADGNTDFIGYWGTGNYKDMRHTISSINGNTLTLNSVIDYTAVQGALVTRLTRDVVVKCTTPGTDYGFFYKEIYTGDWNSTLILKDVYFKDFGNDDSTLYTEVVLRGYYSTSSPPVTLTETIPSQTNGPWVEGLAIHAYPDATHQNDWGPLWMYDCRAVKTRACLTMYGDDGISLYYEPALALFNSITIGNDNFGIRIEGPDGAFEAGYLYSSRNYYGMRVYLPYTPGAGIHSVITDANYYSLQIPGMHNGSTCLYRWQCTGTRYGIIDDNSYANLLYSSHSFLSGLPSVEAGTGTAQAGSYRQGNGYQLANRPFPSVEHNFEYDAVRLYGYQTESYWDNDENAWRLFRRYDNNDNPGLFERVFVPAGTTLRVSGKVKLAPSFSGTYPYLLVVGELLAPYSNVRGASADSRFAGERYNTQYTAAAATDYEEKTLTVTAQNYPRTLIVGVLSNNSNAAEGFWMKNIKILLDQAYASPAMSLLNNSSSFKNNGIITEIGTSLSERKTRLGGRLS